MCITGISVAFFFFRHCLLSHVRFYNPIKNFKRFDTLFFVLGARDDRISRFKPASVGVIVGIQKHIREELESLIKY